MNHRLVLAAASCALILAACGGSQQPDASSVKDTPKPEVAASSADALASAEAVINSGSTQPTVAADPGAPNAVFQPRPRRPRTVQEAAATMPAIVMPTGPVGGSVVAVGAPSAPVDPSAPAAPKAPTGPVVSVDPLNAVYFVGGARVELKNGAATIEDIMNPSGAAKYSVVASGNGDLDGDGNADAVAVISVKAGQAPEKFFVVATIARNGSVAPLNSTQLTAASVNAVTITARVAYVTSVGTDGQTQITRYIADGASLSPR